ncbi:DNA methyltransferase [Pedobacter sp.]|uniref:DNA methyltransferase n=1 Tax=Pedobacter sp. TaxID=1411316 RepID=UPI0031CE8F54
MLQIEDDVKSIETFNGVINQLLSKYKSGNNEPIEVSFRELVAELDKSDRATHLIHTYPAKLLMHIPYFFLNNSVFSNEGDLVLDPFSGSGTVMLESILAKRNAIGADANPLARLISKVKVQKYDSEILNGYKDYIIAEFNCERSIDLPKITNIDYWFLTHVQLQLNKIVNAINSIDDEKYRDFYLVCFSNCVKKVSLADQRVSVPVRLNANRYPTVHPLHQEANRKLEALVDINVFDKFIEVVDGNITRVEMFNTELSEELSAQVISKDARFLTKSLESNELIESETVSLIISSPPYAGAQKYIRASSLNLGWLNFIKTDKSLKELDDLNIGRENYKKAEYSIFKPTGINEADALLEEIHKRNPIRAHIAGNYLIEMRNALKEAVRVLKVGGYFVLVVANNQVCGEEFRTQEYLQRIIEDLGLNVVLRLIDDIKSYGLMTKRNKTASVITREWVLVFKK